MISYIFVKFVRSRAEEGHPAKRKMQKKKKTRQFFCCLGSGIFRGSAVYYWHRLLRLPFQLCIAIHESSSKASNCTLQDRICSFRWCFKLNIDHIRHACHGMPVSTVAGRARTATDDF